MNWLWRTARRFTIVFFTRDQLTEKVPLRVRAPWRAARETIFLAVHTASDRIVRVWRNRGTPCLCSRRPMSDRTFCHRGCSTNKSYTGSSLTFDCPLSLVPGSPFTGMQHTFASMVSMYLSSSHGMSLAFSCALSISD